MDDEAVQLVDKIKAQVDVLNFRIANAVYEYYTSNEFNSIFMFQSELVDKDQCYLLDVLREQFQLRDYQTDWIYNTIYETVFGVPPLQQSDDEEDTDDEDDIKIPSSNQANHDTASVITPSQINWVLSNYEVSKFKTLFGKHFPRLSQNSAYGPGKSIARILAVGRKHNIDLVAVLFDIFMEYRINTFHRTQHHEYIQWKDYMKLEFFQTLPKDAFNDYSQGMDFYIRKFQHVVQLNPLCEINDPYYSFVTYTFALTQALRRLQHLFRSGVACPLQIDFWIIPNTVISVSDRPMIGLGPEFDYIEEDEDDMNFMDELNAPNSDDADPLIGKVEQRLDSGKIEYIKEIINHNEHKNSIVNKMFNAIQFISKKEYKFKRIVMIIDRRHSSSKLNKNSDRMYVYQPNKPYGEIIPNGYCHETFHNLSVSFLLPKLIYEDRVSHISCMDDLKGRMFALSFHIHSWDVIRCYQYMQGGCCTRFRPKYLYQLWPEFFFRDTNRDGFEKITKEVVQKEWKLPLNDKVFETWYPLVTKRQLRN